MWSASSWEMGGRLAKKRIVSMKHFMCDDGKVPTVVVVVVFTFLPQVRYTRNSSRTPVTIYRMMSCTVAGWCSTWQRNHTGTFYRFMNAHLWVYTSWQRITQIFFTGDLVKSSLAWWGTAAYKINIYPGMQCAERVTLPSSEIENFSLLDVF